MKLKKVLSIILSSAMIVSVAPVESFAADLDVAVEEFSDETDEPVVIENEDEALSDESAEVEIQDEDEQEDVEDANFNESQNDIEEFDDGADVSVDFSAETYSLGKKSLNDNTEYEMIDSDNDGIDETLIISGNGDMPDYNASADIPWTPYANSVTKVIVEDGVTNVGKIAFYNMKSIKSADLGKDVIKIGNGAFEKCTKLEKVTMGDNVTDIDTDAFRECSSLSDIRMSENLVNIGWYAFYNCKSLSRLYLPATLKTIGLQAFLWHNKDRQKIYVLPLDYLHYSGTASDWSKIEGKSWTVADEKYVMSGVHYVAYHQSSATCTSDGFDGYWSCGSCSGVAYSDPNCRKKLDKIPTVPALGHDLDSNGIVTKEATCAKEGIIEYKCKRDGCDYAETQVIPKTNNHIYDTPIYSWNTDNTQCTATQICTVCNEGINETANSQKEVLENPTCNHEGKVQYTVSFKNSQYQQQTKEEIIAPLNHSNTEIRYARSATCESSGYTGDVYCKDCGIFLSEGSIIKAKGHLWDEGVIKKNSNCIENGEKIYTCFRCNETRTEKLEKTDHKWNEKETIDLKPTCTTSGRKSIHCSVCDEIEDDSQQIIPALGHNWSEGVVEKKATCTEKGMQIVTCLRCGKEKEEEIPATGHKEVKDTAVAATCEKDGMTEGSHCSVCGKILTEQKTIKATGHSWDAGKITKEATCEEAGVKIYTCTTCSSTKTEDIKALGHKEIKDAAVAATCEKDGLTEGSHCLVCNKVLTEQKKVSATGHKFSSWKTTSQATVFSPEQQSRSCSVCGKSENREIGSKLQKTMTVTATSLPLKTKQKTTVLRVSGLAVGDSIISWKSSNTKVAKVSGRANGTSTITAGNKKGTAKITITLKSGLQKVVKVTVQKSTVKTKKITGVSKSLKLNKKQRAVLRPVIAPLTSKQKITYKSSNSKVASVNSKGQITAKKKGTAVITVKSGSKTVKCKVSVK